MMRAIGSAAIGCLALLHVMPAAAQSKDDVASRLVGTWKVVSVVREEVPSGAKTDLMGPSPTGFITYGPDGRMMVLIMRGERPKPAGDRPSAAEAEALFRSMVSYAGRYTVSGDKLTHHIEVSWNQSWAGAAQSRFVRFDGNRVALSTEVSPDPIDGKISVRTMIWERVR
jgi:hypothetical protein